MIRPFQKPIPEVRTCMWMLILLVLLFPFHVNAQPVVVTAGTQDACPGTVLVPLNADNFNGVASISLKLLYDTLALNYDTIQDLNPSLSNGLFFANATGGKVAMSWFSLVPVSLGNALLMNLSFTYPGLLPSPLTWDTTPGMCQLSDLNGNTIPSSFTDGQVNPSLVTPQLFFPPDGTVNFTLTPILSWNSTGCNPGYRIQVATDSNFTAIVKDSSGITGISLTLYNLNYNTKYYWHVNATANQQVTTWSETWNFSTKNVNTVENEQGNDCIFYPPSPNPALVITRLSYSLPFQATVVIRIMSPEGKCVFEDTTIQEQGQHTINADIHNLPAGIYTCILAINRGRATRVQTRKLIIH